MATAPHPPTAGSFANSPAAPVRGLAALPPLENGDRLTRAEFERRYAAMPHIKKAELIEGVVHRASPVRMASHSEPTRVISTWLGTYQFATPGQVFPGLWMDVPALLREDYPAFFATLQRGLASAEHQAFVTQLHRQ